jgi:outer membrane protein assembly factor BamD (BamD/ComL family)
MQKDRCAPIVRYLVFLAAVAVTGLLLYGCASSRMVQYTHDRKLFVTADSLFEAGNYEYAIRLYSQIRDKYTRTPSGAMAQYKLGYAHIYYDNPFADFTAALREFKRFSETYPDDPRIDMVNNWIRILTVLQDFDQDYSGSKRTLDQMRTRGVTIHKQYENLQDAYLACDGELDSLKRVIISLEGKVDALQRVITALDTIR